jgi:hypothetical protein
MTWTMCRWELLPVCLQSLKRVQLAGMQPLLLQETWLISEYCDMGNLDMAIAEGRFHDGKAGCAPNLVRKGFLCCVWCAARRRKGVKPAVARADRDLPQPAGHLGRHGLPALPGRAARRPQGAFRGGACAS